MDGRRRLRAALTALAAVILLSGGQTALARIKLVTLPVRERVEIQLENPNATLVEEERVVTLLQGTNSIDFSWSNTAIDKGTIQFRVVKMPMRDKRQGDHPSLVTAEGKVEMIRVINVAYPPDENALVWEVFAEEPVAARVRISYLIANLRRSFDYRAVAERDESTLTLRDYIRLDNFSGEEFGDSGIWAGFGPYFHREIGLNEAKQLLLNKFTMVPIKKTYTFDWQNGPPVPNEPEQRYVEMRYVLKNDKEHKMGEFPLQYGKVRIFQKDAHGGEAFTGEDWGKLTPIDDEMKLYLGLARDVQVKRQRADSTREAVRGNLFNQDVVLKYEVQNFKPDALTLDIQEDINRLRDEIFGAKDRDAEWKVEAEGTSIGLPQTERKDSRTAIFHVPLEPAPKGEAKVTLLTVTVHLKLLNEW